MIRRNNRIKESGRIKRAGIIMTAVCVVLLFGGCAGDGGNNNSSGYAGENDYLNNQEAAPDSSEKRPLRPVTATVTLEDKNIKIDGAGASADGSTLNISADGVYEIAGKLSDGQIIIDAPDTAVVELVLAGIDITSTKNAAIYCKKCDELVVTLKENTNNILNDASSYTYENTEKKEPNATLFSKTDMNIGGSGWLTVNANFKHAINSKDNLLIKGGGYKITSAADAVRGNDSLEIVNGKFEINSAGDGFQAGETLKISGGTYDITTGGTPLEESDSQKAFKAETLVTIDGGNFIINSIDDAVHSNTDVVINAGTFNINTEDDGIHADRNLYINGGDINIASCYEGFEGTIIEVNGGNSVISASNDAISAAAGTPEAQEHTGRGANPNVQAWFKGGEISAVAGGDVVDSNGNIYVTGGTLRLSAPSAPDYEGSLLCNGDVTISGGTITAVGNMGVNVYWDKQPVLWFSHINSLPSGTKLEIRDSEGKVVLDYKTQSVAVQSTYTTPEFKVGETYSLYVDGNKKTEITLKDGMNAVGDNGGVFTGGYGRGNMASFRG